MMDVWCGAIHLPGGSCIKEIGLASGTVAAPIVSHSSSLQFLALVDVARIPLYLAAGPSLDVWTTSEESEQWFEKALLSEVAANENAAQHEPARDWWSAARAQCPIGALVKVEDGSRFEAGPRITEILFYGTIATSPHPGSIPTPPSSSPDLDPNGDALLPELRVHALPLCSDPLQGHEDVNLFFPISNPTSSTAHGQAQFLPASSAYAANNEPLRRKRDVFEEATELKKKARRKGGESISAAAAKAHETQTVYSHRKSLSIDAKSTSVAESRPQSAGASVSRPSSRQLSRSPSITSEGRPLSRKGHPDSQNKRSMLSRVETISLQSEEPTMETRNKEALSKVVMAAMRMHGLQQRKRNRSRHASVAPGTESNVQPIQDTNIDETARDEEYKLIYHQTYKGAALALRKHISTEPLHLQPDSLRDVVERLLSIFCADPLSGNSSKGRQTSVLATPSSHRNIPQNQSLLENGSPFDLPSGTRLNGPVQIRQEKGMTTGSPVSREKDAQPRI